MDIAHILDLLKDHKKRVDRAVKLLSEIARLDQVREANIIQIKNSLAKMKTVISELESERQLLGELNAWSDEYSMVIDDSEAEIKKRFGVELERQLVERGHKLGGQYPELQSGLFTIELDFDAGKAKIWYGPKQELLDQCTLSVEDVARGIEKARQGLGSGLGSEEFLSKLNQAFHRVADKNMGDTAPIVNVLSEIALLLQSPRFQSDPRREHYKSYTRADFSFDLYQMRHSGGQLKTEKVPQLVVATRAHTSNRRNFIWIPDEESGRGTTYSHIKIKGG